MVDCQVTLLTPVGRGAIATVAATGSDATRLVGASFQPKTGRSFDQAPIGRIVFGSWTHRGAARTACGREEVVAVRLDPDHVEVHCHGGDQAAASLVATLVAAGASEGSAADWLADRLVDPWRRAALAQLPLAETERVAAILLDQYRGAFGDALCQIADCLAVGLVESAVAQLQNLRSSGRWSTRLVEPWRVVVAGPPNAGKSSLINALLGYERSIVFDAPGTTRDRVESRVALDGWPLTLIDTAGLRHVEEEIEAGGVDRARAAIETADLIVWVVDQSNSESCAQQPESSSEPLIVGNKSDLPVSAVVDGIATSALTGAGIELLQREIVARLIPAQPVPGQAAPIDEAQLQLVEELLATVQRSPSAALQHLVEHGVESGR